MNLLAAGAAEGSPVRKIVVKSSTLMYGSNFEDPYFFRETTRRTHPPTTPVERSLLEVDVFVARLRRGQPAHGRHLAALRQRARRRHRPPCSRRMLRMPAVPEIFGYDPRLQFVHEDDVTGALAHATASRLPGDLQHRRRRHHHVERGVPGGRRAAGWRCPPVFTGAAAVPLRLLRVSTSRPRCSACCATDAGSTPARSSAPGSDYRYTTPATVDAFARSLAGSSASSAHHPEYEYERDVEDFFRHSPAVVRPEG